MENKKKQFKTDFLSINKLVKSLFRSKNKRDQKLIRNIIGSVFIKGASILIGFILVPITINYLGEEEYGIWLTVSSLLLWLNFFQLGLGNGLRNLLSEALAKGKFKLGKIYVSTTYFIITIISILLLILFFIANQFLDWSIILNADFSLRQQLTLLSYIVFISFFVRFVLQLIGNVLFADQRPAMRNIFGPAGNVLALIIIYILTLTTNGSLIYLGFTLSFAPVFILIIATLYFFRNDYKQISPSLSYVKLKYSKKILSIGFTFFLIQLTSLVFYNSANILIAHLFDPKSVTVYNIAYKYFSIVMLIFSIAVTPFWSAFTEAWVKKEISWIKKSVNKLLRLLLLTGIISIVLLLISDYVFDLWIGKDNMAEMNISLKLKVSLVIFFLMITFGGIFNTFINGVSKLRLQFLSQTIGVLIYFPLVYYFVRVLNFGIEGIVLSAIISNFYFLIIAPIQYYKLINFKATGIWNR